MKHDISASMTLLFILVFPFPASAGDLKANGYIESETGFRFPDGTVQTTAATATGYENVIVVAKSGGDFTNVQAAIDSVSPSASSRALIWVAPGTYYGEIVMKPYVTVKGAGRGLTRIGRSGSVDLTGMRGSDGSAIEALTIFCETDADSTCTGLEVEDAVFSARDVDITASADSGGTAIGVNVQAPGGIIGFLSMADATVSAAGGALNIGLVIGTSSYVHLRGSTVRGTSPRYATDHSSHGVSINGGSLTAYDSQINTSWGDDLVSVRVENGSCALRNVVLDSYSRSADAISRGVEIRDNSTVSVDRSLISLRASANQWGILTQTSDPGMDIRVMHSRIEAEDFTVLNSLSEGSAVFLYTHFEGGNVAGTNNECRFSTDESYTAYTSTCP